MEFAKTEEPWGEDGEKRTEKQGTVSNDVKNSLLGEYREIHTNGEIPAARHGFERHCTARSLQGSFVPYPLEVRNETKRNAMGGPLLIRFNCRFFPDMGQTERRDALPGIYINPPTYQPNHSFPTPRLPSPFFSNSKYSLHN